MGAIYDTIKYAEKVVVNEANSVNDNPIVDMETRNVYHGGNFHGDYISLEMDKLKIVVTKMTMLIERELNYLLNPKLNEIFAPFVNLGVPGLNWACRVCSSQPLQPLLNASHFLSQTMYTAFLTTTTTRIL
jgi:histidine ammonia-lyase